jgi:hypothetical protein
MFQHWEHLIVGRCGSDASFDIAQQLRLGLIPTDSEYFKVLQADEVLFPECLPHIVCAT